MDQHSSPERRLHIRLCLSAIFSTFLHIGSDDARMPSYGDADGQWAGLEEGCSRQQSQGTPVNSEQYGGG
jgi:hypothetical protein